MDDRDLESYFYKYGYIDKNWLVFKQHIDLTADSPISVGEVFHWRDLAQIEVKSYWNIVDLYGPPERELLQAKSFKVIEAIQDIDELWRSEQTVSTDSYLNLRECTLDFMENWQDTCFGLNVQEVACLLLRQRLPSITIARDLKNLSESPSNSETSGSGPRIPTGASVRDAASFVTFYHGVFQPALYEHIPASDLWTLGN